MNTEFNGKQYTMNRNDDGSITLTPVKDEAKGLWRPFSGQTYWAVGYNGAGFSSIWNATEANAYHFLLGNVFATKELADRAGLLQARANKFIAAALQADPDAGVWAEERMCTVLHRPYGTELTAINSTGDCSNAAYVHTREQSETMKAILEAEGWE